MSAGALLTPSRFTSLKSHQPSQWHLNALPSNLLPNVKLATPSFPLPPLVVAVVVLGNLLDIFALKIPNYQL
ncbi:hypothetical protein EST38_g2661 [Candolleomyces aberdarensis]|uniref:Uncharacterized protein n=1 Tax=Candolleomyces aberdarensis TaxID=2316362 RepID=A0A4Q2DRV3_9AGAR|nr:hypothetical protein EST38_g2661 [Candolleomyces aberdarensis]